MDLFLLFFLAGAGLLVGTVQAGGAPAETREISLPERMNRIARAFYERFDNYRDGIEFYIRDLFATYLVAYGAHDQKYWRAGYTWDDAEGATFDEPEAWVQVRQEWVPADRELEDLRTRKAALLEQRAAVIVEERPESREVWICPGCREEIREKSLYLHPERGWQHRPCGTYLELPASRTAPPDWLAGLLRQGADETAGAEPPTPPSDTPVSTPAPLATRNAGPPFGDGAGGEAPALHLPERSFGDEYEPRRGELYHRDFATWCPPVPQITRSRDGQRLTVTINTAAVDRHRTIILPEGARLSNYNDTNNIVLINHDYDLVAARSTVALRGTGGQAMLQANVEDRSWDLKDPEVARWHHKITRPEAEGGPLVRSASIGALFYEVVPGRDYPGIEELLGRRVRPNERLPYVITDWELVEWSFVSVPSNPQALVTARALQQLRAFEVSLSGLEARLQTIQGLSAAAPVGAAPGAPAAAPAGEAAAAPIAASPEAADDPAGRAAEARPSERAAPPEARGEEAASSEAPGAHEAPAVPPPVVRYHVVSPDDVRRALREADEERRRREHQIALRILGRA